VYSIEDYGRMIADEVRMGAYSAALRQAVTPDCTVLDLGTGTGIFALLACQYGARKVYAVESADSIAVAERIAHANGFADRIEFIQATSTEIELPERVDVVVADMHGTLPLYRSNIASLIDARVRLCTADAAIIPQRESLWVAAVESPDLVERLVGPWDRNGFGLAMSAARDAVLNTPCKISVPRDQLVTSPQSWGVLDYATIESPNVSATVTLSPTRTGTAHGVLLWFECHLAEGIRFSTAPGEPDLVYRASFLPWLDPLRLDADDSILLRLRADFTGDDYLWSWDTTLTRRSGASGAHFRQSTFWGSPLSRARLRRRAGAFRAPLSQAGQIDAAILAAMDGRASLAEIARAINVRFPGRFASFGEALARVGDLSERYAARSEMPPRKS
jgi:protein arginine N-methyltransferase 1